MSARPSSASDNRHAYIPSSAQAAMSRQMQQSVPAHLQQYVGANKPAYVPQHVQKELTAYMQKAAPAHLKQYAGAFVEQNIMSPAGQPSVAPRPMVGRPPTPDRLNQSHSGEVAAEQRNAQFLNLFQPDKPNDASPASPVAAYGQQSQLYPPPGPQPTPSLPNPDEQHPVPDYSFLNEPAKPAGKLPFKFGGNSQLSRIFVVLGGIVLLVILFVVFKGVLGGSSSYTQAMLTVAQDQQALVHITQNGVQNASSGATKNFAQTATLSLQSEQSQILDYLKANGKSVNTKQLGSKINKATDAQLTAAQSASNFDATFQEIMKTDLTKYQQDLKSAYTQVSGAKGRALLNGDYKAAQLLLTQLGS